MKTDVVAPVETTKSVTIRQVLASRQWQIMMAISVIVMVAVYWQTFRWWWAAWMRDESYYSHAVLIPFMSAFVIYINRQTIADTAIKPSLLGLLILLPALFLQLIGHLSNSATMMGMTLPIVLLGAVILLFGMQMAKQLLFPIAFLFFMCVMPSFLLAKISFKIQLMSTSCATGILNLLQFSAQQNGTQISLPNVDVIVGAPCSGFRMLISLLAFAVFFAYMKEGPLWGKLSLVALTFPLSLLANSLRVALIAVVGELISESAMHVFHDYSGFIVLAVAFIVLWWIAKVVKCEKFRSMVLS